MDRLGLMRELKEAKRRLGPPGMPALEIGWEKRNAEGTLIARHSEPGHSWTRNGWNAWVKLVGHAGSYYSWPGSGVGGELNGKDMWYDTCYGDIYMTIEKRGEGDGGGWSYGDFVGYGFNNINYAVGSEDWYGIVVGSGTAPWSKDGHKLSAIIRHGSGSGQLSHGAMPVSSKSYSAAKKRWTITHGRTFTNNSGADITVNEVGLCWAGWYQAMISVYRCFLMARDVLDVPCLVGAETSVTVYYRIIMDYSEID